jgi:hypothetical protein
LISSATPRFWQSLRGLPPAAQRQARLKYEVWLKDRQHPSLRFKQLRGADGLWSVRISRELRAVGYFKTPSHFIWMWIGSHDEYERLIGS